jgi:hypothetical protein
MSRGDAAMPAAALGLSKLRCGEREGNRKKKGKGTPGHIKDPIPC